MSAESSLELPIVGILGGTGALGRGLACRLAASGVDVLVGSRAPTEGSGEMRNVDCAAEAGLVVVAVPWSAHADVLVECRAGLVGKTVVDAVNPLGSDERGVFALRPSEGSACQQAQRLLAESHVVGAFHHVSAPSLLGDEQLDSDVLVVGDDEHAVQTVMWLVGAVGVRPLFAGPLRGAHQLEALSANLVALNRRYRGRSSLRIGGL